MHVLLLRGRALVLLRVALGCHGSELVRVDVEHIGRHPSGILVKIQRTKTNRSGEPKSEPGALRDRERLARDEEQRLELEPQPPRGGLGIVRLDCEQQRRLLGRGLAFQV